MSGGRSWADEPSGNRPFVDSDRGPRTRPAHEATAGAAGTSGVRPYLITGGRAAPIDNSLNLEAQVMATEDGVASIRMLTYERRDIVALAREPLAVAELAAKLDMHLGVARVLVGDLVGLGMLVLRRPETTANRAYIIERVIRGLQAIH